MPPPTEEEKERRRRLHANYRTMSRGAPELPSRSTIAHALETGARYARRGDRLIGLGMGTTGATALTFAPGVVPTPGVRKWLPDVRQLPKAIGAFDEYRRRGDWDAAIPAFQDVMGGGLGFWGGAEGVGAAVIPTGVPAAIGKGFIRGAPKLAETIARVVPRAVRPGVETGIRTGITRAGQVARAPWEMEEALGRGIIHGLAGGLGWIAGKTVAGPSSRIRNLIDAAQRSGGREAGPGIRALPSGQQPPQQLALPAGRTDLEPSPITGQQLDVGANEVVVTFVTPENPAGSTWIIPNNNATRRTFEALGEGAWGDVDAIEGATPQRAMEQWLGRHRPGEAVMRTEQRAVSIQQQAELSDIAYRITELETQLDALRPPRGKASKAKRRKQREYDDRRSTLNRDLVSLRNRQSQLMARSTVTEPTELVAEELLEGYSLGARQRPLGDLEIFDPAKAFPRARPAFREGTLGQGVIEEPPTPVTRASTPPTINAEFGNRMLQEAGLGEVMRYVDAPGGTATGVPTTQGVTPDVPGGAVRGGGTRTWKDVAREYDTSPPPKEVAATGARRKVDAASDDVDSALEDVRLFHRSIRWAKKLFNPNDTTERNLLIRHEGAVNVAQSEARELLENGNRMLQRLGIGAIRQGKLVIRQQDIAQMDALFEALHNPSKVAAGEIQVPAGLQGIYDDLRGLTEWEEAFRLGIDPEMATVDDYFYRGWQGPKEAFEGIQVGQMGQTPAYKKPRVDATYREMRNAGFAPRSWNPYEQWRISRLQSIRDNQQTQLIEMLKAKELAKPEVEFRTLATWRVPKVGPAFEGKPTKITNALGDDVVIYKGRWAVPDNVANLLENLYGVRPDKSTMYFGAHQVQLMKAIDWLVFVPKRAKLFGSFFQQVDFQTRNILGHWTGMVDALRRGHPIDAVMHLARWPKSAWDILEANFRPGARARIRQQLNSTEELIPGRPGIHFRGIREAGLSTVDTSILPNDVDKMAQSVAEEAGLLGNKAVRRAIGSLESSMRRGLFEGTYPAAQISDIRNNIAPMVVRQHGENLSDEVLNGMIAKIANIRYSTIPATQSVLGNHHPFIRGTLRRLFFSIGETEGLLRQVTGAFSGPEKAYWRTHWVGTYLGLISIANIIHFASTSNPLLGIPGKPLPLNRYAPVSKTEWTDLPIGYSSVFAAPDIPFRDTEGRRLTLDIVGQLDTALRVLDPSSFITSRESVPIRALLTQLSERDYFGESIKQVGPAGIFSSVANLMNDLFTPIGPGQAAVQMGLQQGMLPKGLLPETERRLGTTGQLLQAPGINIRALEGWRTLANRAVRDFTPTILGEELNYYDLDKHPSVVESIKKMLPPELHDLADEYIEADYKERQDIELKESGRKVAEAIGISASSGGVLYNLRGEFTDIAPIEWKMWASLLGISFPDSKDYEERILTSIEARGGAISEEMPSADPSRWTYETPAPVGIR